MTLHIIRHHDFVEGALVIQEQTRGDIVKAVSIQFAGEIELGNWELPHAQGVISIGISAADIGARLDAHGEHAAGRVGHG